MTSLGHACERVDLLGMDGGCHLAVARVAGGRRLEGEVDVHGRPGDGIWYGSWEDHPGTDSSAAKSFASRRGVGKMRHIEIRDLWLQKEVAEGKVEVIKVKGEENPGNELTKHVRCEVAQRYVASTRMRLSSDC